MVTRRVHETLQGHAVARGASATAARTPALASSARTASPARTRISGPWRAFRAAREVDFSGCGARR